MQQDTLGELGGALHWGWAIQAPPNSALVYVCLSVLVFSRQGDISKLGGSEDQAPSISQELGQRESSFTSQKWDLSLVTVPGRRYKDSKHLWRPLNRQLPNPAVEGHNRVRSLWSRRYSLQIKDTHQCPPPIRVYPNRPVHHLDRTKSHRKSCLF